MLGGVAHSQKLVLERAVVGRRASDHLLQSPAGRDIDDYTVDWVDWPGRVRCIRFPGLAVRSLGNQIFEEIIHGRQTVCPCSELECRGLQILLWPFLQ